MISSQWVILGLFSIHGDCLKQKALLKNYHEISAACRNQSEASQPCSKCPPRSLLYAHESRTLERERDAYHLTPAFPSILVCKGVGSCRLYQGHLRFVSKVRPRLHSMGLKRNGKSRFNS